MTAEMHVVRNDVNELEIMTSDDVLDVKDYKVIGRLRNLRNVIRLRIQRIRHNRT